MNIKFLDLVPSKELQEQLDEAKARVFATGRFIGGEEVEAFEQEWADYLGAKYCVACGNGFDALVLCLLAMVKPGSGVAVHSRTCLPTWAAIEAAGMTVVPLDNARNSIDEGTIGAIMPVHLYGIPHSITINANNVPYIQDAAQAHGSFGYDGKKIGSSGTCAWSFYPTKNLGCYGDGGAVTTDDKYVAQYIRELRNYGGNHFRSGINSRLDSLQAAFLRVKLPYLDLWNERRNFIAFEYTRGIRWNNNTLFPAIRGNDLEFHLTNWHQFVVGCNQRDDLALFLRANGIETMIHYADPPHKHMCFSAYRYSCPNADRWSSSVLSLPIAPHLTNEQVEYIIAKVNKWVDKTQSK